MGRGKQSLNRRGELHEFYSGPKLSTGKAEKGILLSGQRGAGRNVYSNSSARFETSVPLE